MRCRPARHYASRPLRPGHFIDDITAMVEDVLEAHGFETGNATAAGSNDPEPPPAPAGD